jgi:hypothetical protein
MLLISWFVESSVGAQVGGLKGIGERDRGKFSSALEFQIEN